MSRVLIGLRLMRHGNAKFIQRLTFKMSRITSHEAMQGATMNDEEENMASSVTPMRWEGWCFHLDLFHDPVYPSICRASSFTVSDDMTHYRFVSNFSPELRKKARQLENEIDLKLVSFSKLGTNYSHHNGFKER